MIIKYFNNSQLSYSNRKRYSKFSFEPFSIEEQRAVKYGDGANCQITTNKKNICNYVMIDNTRWYVISYTYLNGAQVVLNLQRDVIGEFGINDCFGKIERGYTDNILKYRKELNLNQILKKRQKLVPNITQYGNARISSIVGGADPHKGEMWGILYFSKPIDSSGELNIIVSSLIPQTVDYPLINNGDFEIVNCTNETEIQFVLNLQFLVGNNRIYGKNYYRGLQFFYNNSTKSYRYNILNFGEGTKVGETPIPTFVVELVVDEIPNDDKASFWVNEIMRMVGDNISNSDGSGWSFPNYIQPTKITEYDYNDITIKKDNNYLKYSVTKENYEVYGIFNFDNFYTYNFKQAIYQKQVGTGYYNAYVKDTGRSDNKLTYINNQYTVTDNRYNYVILSPEDAGNFVININKQLIDEPFVILCCPLFNTRITMNDGTAYNIDKTIAFNIFNNIILSTSGENGSLVDAQIYPYCPTITSIATLYKEFPLFQIASSNYNYACNIQLLPYSDIKKEYIKREYSIISPEQSSKFTFNYYDYKRNVVNEQNGINYDNLQIVIKTALKPFSIISSAVITRDQNSLKGIPYEADLNGCQPTGNGFESSLGTNAFQEYSRNNSNYDKLFNLQFEEMQLSHKQEAINEITQGIFNTANATAFGAIAGSEVAGLWGKVVPIGGAIGGAAGGLSVGAAATTQGLINKDVRADEERIARERYDLQIGTIKNIPNTISRISSFNEILLSNFYYVIETYECTQEESSIVDTFINMYGYGIGVYDYALNYYKKGWFLKCNIITSSYSPNLHSIAAKELMGGIYYYDNAE